MVQNTLWNLMHTVWAYAFLSETVSGTNRKWTQSVMSSSITVEGVYSIPVSLSDHFISNCRF